DSTPISPLKHFFKNFLTRFFRLKRKNEHFYELKRVFNNHAYRSSLKPLGGESMNMNFDTMNIDTMNADTLNTGKISTDTLNSDTMNRKFKQVDGIKVT